VNGAKSNNSHDEEVKGTLRKIEPSFMLTSKGVAGVSRASIVILLGTVGSFGLPTEPIFILLGIDQLMDMARTSVNVIGNCLASVVIARWEISCRPLRDEHRAQISLRLR